MFVTFDSWFAARLRLCLERLRPSSQSGALERLPKLQANLTRKQFRTNGISGQNRETGLQDERTIRPANWIVIGSKRRLGEFTSEIGVGMASADYKDLDRIRTGS
jgi:hypothetical protein